MENMEKDTEERTGMALYIGRFTIPEGSTGREKHPIEHKAGLKLLETGLCQRFGLELSPVEAYIRTGEKGKPYLPAYPHIHFNISHSGNMAVCALGRSPLGVDVEKIRPVRLYSTKRMLTGQERAFLEDCPARYREEALFRFWTLKESYAKALGAGLSMDFTKIGFSLGDVFGAGEKTPHVLEPAAGCLEADRGRGDRKRWRSVQMVWEGYVISICAKEMLEEIRSIQ